MNNKLLQTKLGVFSEKFVKFQLLPFGIELHFYRKDGRKIRTNMLIDRKGVNAKNINKLDDDDTVKSLLAEAIKALSIDIQNLGWTLKLYDGAKRKFIIGNTKIGTVRKKDAKLTADEMEQKYIDEQLMIEIQDKASSEIINSEYQIDVDDPSITVCSAYVSALVSRYGRQAVESAL